MSEQLPQSRVTDEARRQFKRNGFYAIHDALDDDLVEEAKRVVLEEDATPNTQSELDEIRDSDPEDLPLDFESRDVKPGTYKINFDGPEHDVFEAINERAHAYAEQFVGEGLLAEPGAQRRIVLRFPRDNDLTDIDAPKPSDLVPHLDTSEGPAEFTVAVGIYLNDIQPRGGGFLAWPGTHRVVGDLYEDGAIEDFNVPKAPTGDGGWTDERNLYEVYEPVELSGSAGTIVIWHNNLLHSGGLNLRPGRVRMAMFTRLAHHNHDEIKADAAAHPFKYWDAMDGINIDQNGGIWDP